MTLSSPVEKVNYDVVLIFIGYLECFCFYGSFCYCDFKKINFKKIWLVIVSWI
jgi:hypothetical protein